MSRVLRGGGRLAVKPLINYIQACRPTASHLLRGHSKPLINYSSRFCVPYIAWW